MAHVYSPVIQGHSLGMLHRDPICFELTYTRNSDESLTIMGFSSKRVVFFLNTASRVTVHAFMVVVLSFSSILLTTLLLSDVR
jgi:hypothetical protein